MREIDFRAYYKPLKKYLPISSISLKIGVVKDSDPLEIVSLEGVSSFTLYGVERLNVGTPVIPESVVVEQYAGLKDKNGRKIYEGDMFRNTINGGTWRVSWNEDDAAFWVDSGLVGCSLGEFDWDRSRREHGFIRRNCEVIGNIHENPELLKGSEEKENE